MSHYHKEMVSLYMNTTCNLDCKYCYTNKQNYTPQFLDLGFAESLIRDYFSRQEYSGFKRVIRFFAAGEPTLNIDAVKHIVEFSRKHVGNDVEFELQTNGILTRYDGEYDFEMAKWIAENIDYIWISCDGIPDIQNEYRPIFGGVYESPPKLLSHELVEQTIKVCLPICKKMIGVRMTIVEKNLCKQKEMIQYFYDLGIRDIWADPLFPSVGQKNAIEEIDLDLFAKEFIEACNFAASFGADPSNPKFDKVIYGSNYTCNFDEEIKHYCRACKPVPHATTDGYVSSCDMAMFKEAEGSISACMNKLIYGYWDASLGIIQYDLQKMQSLRDRNCDNLNHCQGCIARLHCGGYCLGEITNETGRLDGILPSKCNTVRYLYQHMNQRQRHYRYSHP